MYLYLQQLSPLNVSTTEWRLRTPKEEDSNSDPIVTLSLKNKILYIDYRNYSAY